MAEITKDTLAQMDEFLGLDPEEEAPEAEAPENVAEEVEDETAEAVVEAAADEDEPVADDDEPADEEPDDEGETEEPEHLYAGKYKSAEEMEKALENLQSKLGEQGSELGELRKMRELMEERLPELEEPGFDFSEQQVNWFDEQIDTNPQAAAIWALQNDATGTLYDRAMDAWSEMPGQLRKATQFERAIEQARLKEELVAETQPLKEQASKQDILSAWQAATKEVPDLGEYADAILAEAKDTPALLTGADTVEAKTKALVKLYRLVKGGQAATVETVAGETAKAEADASRKAKLSGAAPAQTKAVTPPKVSDSEAEIAKVPGFAEFLDRHSAPVE